MEQPVHICTFMVTPLCIRGAHDSDNKISYPPQILPKLLSMARYALIYTAVKTILGYCQKKQLLEVTTKGILINTSWVK